MKRAPGAESMAGWSILARLREAPDIDVLTGKLRGNLDTIGESGSSLADEAVEGTGVVAQKLLAIPGDPPIMCIQKAAGNAARDVTPHLRSPALAPYIGVAPVSGDPRVFSTMGEFEFARSVPIGAVRSTQQNALKVVRAFVEEAVDSQTMLRKFLPPDALAKYEAGHFGPQVGGFFARAAETDDLVHAGRVTVRDGMGLDYVRSPFNNSGGGYCSMTFPAGDNVAHVKVPKAQEGMHTPMDIQVNAGPPFTGNGTIAGADGRMRREYHYGTEVVDGQTRNTLRNLPMGTVVIEHAENGVELGRITLTMGPDMVPMWVR